MRVEKKELLALIEELPDEIELEEVMYRFYLRKKLESAVSDLEAGRAETLEEALKRSS